MDKEKVIVHGLAVQIDRNKVTWQKDKLIFFANNNGNITDGQVVMTIEYLYSEGFILDRGIRYEIVQK